VAPPLAISFLHGALGAWDEIAFAIILTAILLGFAVLFVRSARRNRHAG
jgi:multisubunit Na+/H+ antiporter MnhC subunit